METRAAFFSALIIGVTACVTGCGDQVKSEGGGGGSDNTDAATSSGGSSGSSGTGGATGGTGGAGGISSGGASTGGSSGAGGSGGTATDGGVNDSGMSETDAGYTPPRPMLPPAVAYIVGGDIAPLGFYTGIDGNALIVRSPGQTVVQLHVEGLQASTDYPAHVHALPCDVNTAGDHYKIDPTVTMSDETNEIWLPFTTDSDGVGNTSVTVSHYARPDAQSIVIHDPDASNAKMACVDLLPEPISTISSSGAFAPFASAAAIDANIAGTATLVRTAYGTSVALAVTGLDPAESYASHVHAMPCAVDSADGHYKIDPTIATSMQMNELWPTLAANGSGAVDTLHIARPDAQSVVIHRTDMGTSTSLKVACADLVRVDAYLPYQTEGDLTPFTLAFTRGFIAFAGSATMVRHETPSTSATLTVTGLAPSTDYTAHVHNLSCALQSGGSHYQIDTTQTSSMESNEIWLNFTTDNTGAGSATTTVAHLARPDAASIVVHDTDGQRLGCIDLK